MVTARALLTGHIDGITAAGLTPVTAPITCAWAVDTAVGQIDSVTLAAGDTTLTVPQTGTTGTLLLLIPPPTNTTAITLKGASGDTGVPLVPNCGHLLGTTAATIIVNAAAAITGVRLIWL